MKRIVIISAVTCATFALGSIQTSASNRVFSNPDNHLRAGARVALDMSCPDNFTINGLHLNMLNSAPGISFGGVCQIPIVANLYLEPGVSFYYDTYLLDIQILGNQGYPLTDKFDNRSLRTFGMLVPVQAGYHFDFIRGLNVHVFTGPVLKVGFSNDYNITYTEENHKHHLTGSCYHSDSMIPLRRLDVDWRVGIGVDIKDFTLDLSGDIGMLNQHQDPYKTGCKFYDNTFRLTLGYNFNL